MEPQDFDMIQRRQPRAEFGQPARRDGERIAAGDDHLPDLLMRGEIGEGGVERRVVEQALACPAPTRSRRKQKRQ